MVERFNAVARSGHLQFEAWFTSRTETGRSWRVEETEWEFAYRYLPAVGRRPVRLALPTPLLASIAPDVLVSLYEDPSFLIGSSIARRRGIRTALWCEVTFDTWVRRRKWKELLKRQVFRRADATIGSGQQGRAYAMRYGVPPERALTLPHVIDADYFARAAASARLHRDRDREALGLRGVTFIYVGRLWAGKGLNYLVDAFRDLQQRVKADSSLLLVGDGPEEQYLRAMCQREGLRNVVFAGFKDKRELPRFYAAADVFTFPTLGDPYGLVLDEALACSLPLVSTSSAGEISDRIDEGVNGFIVTPSSSEALCEKMEILASDSALRRRMSAASGRKAIGRTPSQWATNFENVIGHILSMPALGRGIR
jgi:glycosyltransferase involved in cell wall biosynthesis